MGNSPSPEDRDPDQPSRDRLAFLAACADESKALRYLIDAVREMKSRAAILRDRWRAVCRSLQAPEFKCPPRGFQRTERVEDFSALTEAASEEILSLDVFDTCLVRDLNSPVELFELLGGQVQEMGLMEAGKFVRERQKVEQDLRRDGLESGAREDVSFKALYSELARRHGWERSAMESLMDAELRLEHFFLRADPTVRALAQNHARNGGRVVYTSEMYLDGESLRGLLQGNGFPVEEGTVFSSGEHGLSKGTGNLFRHLASEYSGRKVLHVGDNETSDGTMAREAGLSTCLIKTARSLYPDLLSNVLSAVRAKSERADSGNFWQTFGYRIAGPLHFAFAANLYREARRSGREAVYFLSRDGWFPRKVFGKLQEVWGRVAEDRYLYASREYFGLGSMREIHAHEWNFLLKPAPLLRAEDCLSRIGIPGSLHDPTLMECGLPAAKERVCHHWGFIHPDFRDKLYRAICSRLDEFLAYRNAMRSSLSLHLEQSGIFEHPSLFVDLGWGGSAARALRSMVPQGGNIPQGYYFALFEPSPACSSCFNPDGNTLRTMLLKGSVALLEFLFGSPEPTVRGMDMDSGGPRPVFRKQWPAYDQDAWREMGKGILEFAGNVLSISRQLPDGNGLALIEDVLRRLIFDPSPEELDHLGNLCHGEGWGTDNRLRMLPRLSLLEGQGALHEAFCYCPWKPGLQKLLRGE